MPATWVLASGFALLKEDGDGSLHLSRVDGQGALDAAGPLAREVLDLVDEGIEGPRIRALVAAGLGDVFRGLAGSKRTPLSPTSALELGGFAVLFLELVGRCNERCIHCYADAAPEVDTALDQETCERIVDDARDLGFRTVQLTGGDPLLCAFLPEIAGHVRRNGLSVEIYTNGLALSDKLLERLSPSRPSFAFSFYSHRPEVHDAITRTPGSQARTSRAIERALAAGHAVRASIIAMEENHDDLEGTVAHLRALGVSSIDLAPARTVGRGTSFHGRLDAKALGVGRAAHGGEAAQTTRGKLAVASDGSVFPCIFNRTTRLGDVRSRSLVDIVRQPEVRRSLTTSAANDRERLQCASCRLTASALRACAGVSHG